MFIQCKAIANHVLAYVYTNHKEYTVYSKCAVEQQLNLRLAPESRLQKVSLTPLAHVYSTNIVAVVGPNTVNWRLVFLSDAGDGYALTKWIRREPLT